MEEPLRFIFDSYFKELNEQLLTNADIWNLFETGNDNGGSFWVTVIHSFYLAQKKAQIVYSPLSLG